MYCYFPTKMIKYILFFTSLVILQKFQPSMAGCEDDWISLLQQREPLHFEQLCCNSKNLGKSFNVRNGEYFQYMICPNTMPSSCARFRSCQSIYAYDKTSTSGYYNIITTDGMLKTVYCLMSDSSHPCGSGGWMRIAYHDMSIPGAQCPTGLSRYTYSSLSHATCGPPSGSPIGCTSSSFSPNGFSYYRICGRVKGYQYGHSDAFLSSSSNDSINSNYVDGVSITVGNPRTHVWTYAVGEDDYQGGSDDCPCNTGSTVSVPSFIGSSYYCESSPTTPSSNIDASDVLWDGKQCHSVEYGCCTSHRMPWFYRYMGLRYDDVEFRMCTDESVAYEGARLDLIELYIK